jgi:uroporphyrinogen III methyltransferase / synthase
LTAQLSTGTVYLVGAGPGDATLITVRGARLLDVAQVVVYDALVNPSLLSYCPQADCIYVGKRAAQHTFSQEQINDLLIEKARAGKTVVRLKGGDPFVFGRGGEECEALRTAGIAFEVVPGITAAIAAPAYAGIPVTHRDFNSSFTLITGHEKDDDGATDLDWAVIAKLPCVAFYMGVKSLPKICERLIEHGMDRHMPAAIIERGTTPRQRTTVGTLGDIATRAVDAGVAAPALTIIGKVVSLRQTISWFETKPLFGQTIVVTRTRQQASELSLRLEQLGANVLEAPTIELSPPGDWSEVDATLKSLASFDWVVFTSANGVAYTKGRLFEIGLDARAFGNAKIAAIGDATASAIRELLGLSVDVSPKQFVAEALADDLIQRAAVKGKRFALLRAEIARALLRERLVEAGAAEVRDVAVYETRQAASLPVHVVDALSAGQIQWVTFTSSSTAKNFAALVGSDYREKLKGVKIASIGPVTSDTLEKLDIAPTIQAETFNIGGLIDSLARTGRG